MRVGMNPQKAEKKLELGTHHRIIVVVYIPNEEGFYAHMLSVFKLCLDSLVATISNRAAITIVNNGSHQKLVDLLNDYHREGKIDCVISHRTNIGKIDALVGAARGSREPYITMSDADVLFKAGWQEAVEAVFVNMPRAGSVSPIPVKNGIYYATASTLKEIVLGRLKFQYADIPENGESYNRYLTSINWDTLENPGADWPVVQKNGFKAMLGSGHQVLTVRRDLFFTTTPTKPSFTLVGGKSEVYYVDNPITVWGKLRLATYHNFAYHMGNKVEPWMEAVQRENETANRRPADLLPTAQPDLFHSWFKAKYRVLEKMFFAHIFRRYFDKYGT